MAHLYASRYDFPLFRSRGNFWKLGRSSNPKVRVARTTGTVHANVKQVKVWPNKGHLEGSVLQQLGAAFPGSKQGEWVRAPSDKAFLRRVALACRRGQAGAKGKSKSRVPAPAPRRIRRARGLRRPQ